VLARWCVRQKWRRYVPVPACPDKATGCARSWTSYDRLVGGLKRVGASSTGDEHSLGEPVEGLVEAVPARTYSGRPWASSSFCSGGVLPCFFLFWRAEVRCKAGVSQAPRNETAAAVDARRAGHRASVRTFTWGRSRNGCQSRAGLKSGLAVAWRRGREFLPIGRAGRLAITSQYLGFDGGAVPPIALALMQFEKTWFSRWHWPCCWSPYDSPGGGSNFVEIRLSESADVNRC